MTTQQMQYIIALVEEGSFSGAAAKLFVSQPAISQVIKRTEQQLDIILFERNTKKMTLTPAGEAFYYAAKKIEATQNELTVMLSDIKDLKFGKITIGTSPFRASCLLPKSLFLFKKTYPGIEINTVFDSIDHLKKNLIEEKIDFCIETDLFDPKTFQTETLSTETYFMAVPKNHVFNQIHSDDALTEQDIFNRTDKYYQAKNLSLAIFDSMPLLTLGSHDSNTRIFNELCSSEQFKPTDTFETHNLNIMFQWIIAGYGSGLIPDTQIRFNNYKVHPSYYKIADSRGSFGTTQSRIVVAYTLHHYFSKAVREYLHLLQNLINQGDWLLNAKSDFDH